MVCSKPVYDALREVAGTAEFLVGQAFGVEEGFNPTAFYVGASELNALSEALSKLEQAQALEEHRG